MEYIAVSFRFSFVEDFASDIFVAELAKIGFESFENIDINEGIIAYIPTVQYNAKLIDDLVSNFPFKGVELNETITIADQNWNEEWEKYFFQPIIIADECVVRSSFHEGTPKLKYEILINPKMAFGTGHHATTSLLLAELLRMDLHHKTVLDMGCGTGVLAILARMRGAGATTAIDIDTWCTDNALENIELNNIEGIQVLLGDAKLLAGKHFDVIIANINRNILLADMHIYADCLPKEGALYLSGFYTEDVSTLESEAVRLGFRLDFFNEKDNWAMMKLVKVE